MDPQLKQTKNYELFRLHPWNRDVRKINKLIKSMKKYGFRPHDAISCVKNGNDNKLVVMAGHHRLEVAKALNLPVWYILADPDDMTIQEAEETRRAWDLKDYLTSFVKNGLEPYIAIDRYVNKTGIPLGLAIALLAGDSSGSGNRTLAFKRGLYKLGDQQRANDIMTLVLFLRDSGFPFAANSFLVRALSKMLWVKEFSISRFKQKIKAHGSMFEHQANVQGYLAEIEKIYNRQSKDRIPLVFLAEEVGRERQATFGGTIKKK